jgi:hypothetical protein
VNCSEGCGYGFEFLELEVADKFTVETFCVLLVDSYGYGRVEES